MTIEELEQYRDICAEIKELRNQSKKDIDDMFRLSELNKTKNKIDNFVKNIPIKESKIKRIVNKRYIKGKNTPSWQSVAMYVGYRGEHTPKRKLEEYLKNSRKL